MKLGRTARLVLGIGIFVFALATLFMFYARQSGGQEELEKSLAGAQTQLTNLISGRESLASLLAQQQSKLAEAQSTVQASFPKVGASIEYNEVLSELARLHNLEVVSVAATQPREQKMEDVTFIVISFEVGVRGEVNSILGMVNDIAKDKRFASATVEVVNIQVPEPQPITTGVAPEEPSATIKLVGYSYGGE
jgi:hypothetical protein